MARGHKIRWKAYFITFLVGAAVAAGILVSRDVMHLTTQLDRYHVLCDAFFIPGILMVCFGIMVLIVNTGFFYVFDYSIKLFADRFTRQKKFKKMYHTYYDYFCMKKGAEKDPLSFILITGLFYIGISILFNIGFYSEYL